MLTEEEWRKQWQAVAERHEAYDRMVLSALKQMREELNDLRRIDGLAPVKFETLPDAPPLLVPTARDDWRNRWRR